MKLQLFRAIKRIISLFAFASLLLYGCKKDEPVIKPSGEVIPISKIYTANEASSDISVVDCRSGKLIRNIDISEKGSDVLMPHNVQVSPDGKTVWVTLVAMPNMMDRLAVIDAVKDTLITKIELGENLHPAHVVLDAESKYAYVSCTQSNEILQIDAKTYEIVKSFKLGDHHQPHGMRYFNGKLYVSNMESMSMSVIDIASGQITEVMLDGMAMQTGVTPDGKYAFASLFDKREIIRYDLQTAEIKRIPLPADAQGPIQVYPTQDSKQLYVCDQGMMYGKPASNKVYVIDVSGGTVTNTIIVGDTPHGVVISRDGKRAYVSLRTMNSVAVIDILSRKVTSTISIGSIPNGISYWDEKGGMP